jgi:site-specific DNA-methyltransferase (adenine-specific)
VQIKPTLFRTYNGNNDLWGEHVWKAVIQDLHRVTKDGGVVVWVVGDATIKGSETGTSFKQALWAKECGFALHDTMIYKKQNPLPNTQKRYYQSFEYMFVFSKGAPKTFNPIMVESKYGGQENFGQRTTYNKNGSRKESGKRIINKYKKIENIFTYFVGSGGGNNKSHPASFPYQLAHDHIISWSNPGDVILDCFAGSFTTGAACLNTGRSFIGIEREKAYFSIGQKRIEELQRQLTLSL